MCYRLIKIQDEQIAQLQESCAQLRESYLDGVKRTNDLNKRFSQAEKEAS